MNQRPGRALIVLLLAAAALPATASANMASPNQPGDAVGEPAGDLVDLHVEHESLRIDLRPLERADRALVEANYKIRNDGPGRTVELVFVATAMEGTQGGVWLDGKTVAFKVGGGAEPLPWTPPRTTPGLDGQPLDYLASVNRHLQFSLTIGPGRHDVTVRYAARAGSYSGSSPARYWQLGYVLAPARQWPSFGTLDVVVDLPAGWQAASEPPMVRTGDELRGSFDGVPADALAITTQAQVSVTWWLPSVAVVAIVLAVGLFIAGRGGRFLAARGRRVRWLLPVSLTYSFIGAVVIVTAGISALSGQYVPDAQHAWTYGYGATLLLLLAYPLIVVGSTITMQMLAGRAATRAAWQARPPTSGSA